MSTIHKLQIESGIIVSAKIIEFFWLLPVFVIGVTIAIMKFKQGKPIHKEIESQPNTLKGQQYALPPQQQDGGIPKELPAINDEQVQINLDPSIQSNITVPNSVPSGDKGIVEKVYDGFDNLVNNNLPILSIAIFNILNFSSKGFAVACVFLYLFKTLMFVELDVQKNFSNEKLKVFLRYSNHIWIFGLCINYFVVDQYLKSDQK
ncbi:hypothetical protein pb186bvf_019906 [Paramecium bursaria]